MPEEQSGAAGVSYFSCTLGQAKQINRGRTHFKSVNDLLRTQARHHPNDFAVGFPVPRQDGENWGSQVFTFQQLNKLSTVSHSEDKQLKNIAKNSKTIALLCPSSIEFLLSWLRLMNAGYSVLIIAPQCGPEAIAHLCKSCNAHGLLRHETYSDLAAAASRIPNSSIQTLGLPWGSFDLQGRISENEKVDKDLLASEATYNDIAYIFHTTGTSSGLPKPIPQNQHGSVGVLPSLNGREAATFTTTPLYHGGVSDTLRAWSSGAMIWLFPGAEAPITTKNILFCLSTADKSVHTVETPEVKYFPSVPYVLEMLSMEKNGLAELKRMDMVGVGGAALSPNVGDRLIQEGVRLLSRFGSAECGFLLSSHRDFANDAEWQFLRAPVPSPYLRFDSQADNSGLCELVILKGWPHMSKTNRENGSFATSDLFEPHPKIKGAWRYHSRSDSQITLVTGKKFDPAPLEDAIRSALEDVRDVLIVGNGKQEPAALIIPSQKTNHEETEFKQRVWDTVKHLNEKGQAHTRVAQHMLLFLQGETPHLEKSSKGTVQRRKAEERFARQIEEIYGDTHHAEKEGSGKAYSKDEIRFIVGDIMRTVLGEQRNLGEDDDFYQHGVDSNQCARIRHEIQEKIFHGGDPLPFNIVYDCGSPKELSIFIIARKNGSSATSGTSDQSQYMLDLVDRFGTFTDAKPMKRKQSILTGATGSLGAHILHVLRQSSFASKILCLVRESSQQEAHARVSASLILRKKPALALNDDRVLCVPAQLEDSNLWQSSHLASYVKKMCGMIIHAAWAVNFSIPLKSFEGQLQGLQNLLNLARSCKEKPQFLFCSSIASVSGNPHTAKIAEVVSNNAEDSDKLGYSKSKWVAEAICNNAWKTDDLKDRVKILRIGQLTGDTVNGVWNMSEAWSLMLSTVEKLNCLPRLEEDLGWLPVNIAAEAIVEIGLSPKQKDTTCAVFHLMNTKTTTKWSDLLTWAQHQRSFDIVALDEWLGRLEGLDKHPAKNLAWLWKKIGKESLSGSPKTVFTVERAERVSEAMRNVRAVDQDLAAKIWSWLMKEISGRQSNI